MAFCAVVTLWFVPWRSFVTCVLTTARLGRDQIVSASPILDIKALSFTHLPGISTGQRKRKKTTANDLIVKILCSYREFNVNSRQDPKAVNRSATLLHSSCLDGMVSTVMSCNDGRSAPEQSLPGTAQRNFLAPYSSDSFRS